MDDKDRGLYHKFSVTRTDGRSEPGEKHHKCAYFVLDMNHDRYAPDALLAYANVCDGEYPKLADHIRNWVADWPPSD